MIKYFYFSGKWVPLSIKRAAPNDGTHTTVLQTNTPTSNQTLTQSSSFTNSNTLNYTHVVTQPGGDQSLTQSSRFDNSNTLNYQHVIINNDIDWKSLEESIIRIERLIDLINKINDQDEEDILMLMEF